MEGRSDRRQDSQRPPDPLPSRFLDWSILESPQTRTSPHSSPDIRTEQQENIQNLMTIPSAAEIIQDRDRASSQEGVPVAPQVDQLREEQNVSSTEVAPDQLHIEVETQRYDVHTNRANEDNVVPVAVSASVRSPLNMDELVSDQNVQQEARYRSDVSRSSHVRSQDEDRRVVPNVIPLERLTLGRDRTVVSENMDRTQHHQHERVQSPIPPTYTRRNIPDDSSDEHRSFRDHGYYHERGRPLGEPRYPSRGRRPL